MALDKDKIMSELNSVMTQLQSADCGCMEKLFANNNNHQMNPMHMGCRGGGCCRQTPCNYGMPAGEPNSFQPGASSCMANNPMGNSCMPGGNFNPKQMYNDTYGYLNKNLMQPTMREIYEDFRNMNSSNTITSSPQGDSKMGTGMSNAGGGNMAIANAGGNMGMMNAGGNMMGTTGGEMMTTGDGGMGMANPRSGIMGMAGTGGEMDMANVQGGNMGMARMGAGNMGMPNMDQGNMQGMGMEQKDMSPHNMGPQIMNMLKMFGGSNSPSKVPKLSMAQQGVMVPNNMDPNMPQAPNALQGQMSGEPMSVPGGQMIPQHGGGQHNMHMGHGQRNMVNNNMAHGGMSASNRMQDDVNMSPIIPGQDLTIGNMGALSPSPANIAQPVPGQGQMFVPQSQGNFGAANMTGGTMNVPNLMRGNHMGQRNGGVGGNAMENRGVKFNQMFPGATSGVGNDDDLDFDPMSIAMAMNPANQKKAAVNMINKLMCGNRGFANQIANVMAPNAPLKQQQLPSSESVSAQPPHNVPVPTANADPNAQYQTQPTDQSANQVPQSGDPNAASSNQYSASPETNAVPPNQKMADGEGYPAQERKFLEPIYPADTRRYVAPPPQMKEPYELNALGQPVQMIPAERYYARHLPLPQTLSPQPVPMNEILNRNANDPMKYQSVKSTVSKTSIAIRSTTRLPSRARLNQSGYKGSLSDTVHNVRQPVQGGSHSDGKLNVTPHAQNLIPIDSISKVAGDATSGQQNVVPVKVESQKGQPEGIPTTEVPQSLIKGRHNGLQDRVFTPCPNSSWSFGGPPRNPYGYSYVPAAPMYRSTNRRRRY